MKHPFAAAVAVLTALALVMGGTASLLIDDGASSELRPFASEAEMLSFLGSHRPVSFLDGPGGREIAAMEDAADRSGTNVQVAGVDEGDMVKTDGQHIYISDGQAVHIVRAGADGLHNVSAIAPAGGLYIEALYLEGGTLIVVRSHQTSYVMNAMQAPPAEESTILSSYDVSDPTRPVLTHEVGASGWYAGSRMAGGTVYAVVQKNVWMDGRVTPPVLTRDGRAEAVKATEVMHDPSVREASSFISLLAFDIASGESTCLTAAAPASSVMYMSPTSLYLTMPDVPRSGARGAATAIYRFDVDGPNATLAARGSVDGYLISQFCMDERGGHLRVASTSGWSSPSTAVTVLDRELKEVGKLADIAPGESLYSCRFMGDRLYLVTAIQVDPLFVVDLSDPTSPSLRGQLKVPGISTYLQMTSHGLLGIGAENGTLKVSLFDVTGDSPLEIDTYRFDGAAYSEGQWDHHAVLWDERYGLLSLPVQRWSGDGWYRPSSSLAVLSVGGGIELAGEIVHEGASVQRALYIGDVLYSISTTMVKASSLPDLSEEGSLTYRTAPPGWYEAAR